MNPVLAAVIKAAILPPGLNLLMAACAIPFWPRHRRMAVALLAGALLLLYLLSTPVAARRLAGMLEDTGDAMPAEAALRSVQAIVVPGCDRYRHAPEFDGRDEVSACTLVRLAYAVQLHELSGLPLLLSGGRPGGEEEAEAELMQRALEEHFHIQARWLETRSRNTAENAAFSASLLAGNGIRRICLVTHALHMARARWSFERAGLEVVPAPTGFHSSPPRRPLALDYLPEMGALEVSHEALYEFYGLAWYRLAFRHGRHGSDLDNYLK